jgi:formamidopyrimidine-DNA glycosylase
VPELAEVEFFRSLWNRGLGQRVRKISIHAQKRLFRGIDAALLQSSVEGARLLGSQAHGKQLLFKFSKQAWLGIHLGMTGKLSVQPAGFQPEKHDHLVLHQSRQALVFTDPRLFGRVLFHSGADEPGWWKNRPPDPRSPQFTLDWVRAFLQRRRRAPLKAVLLLQEGFPGIGNWMADEILWRARVDPGRLAGDLDSAEQRKLWRAVLWVSREAVKIIGHDFSDPPPTWLFPHRWEPDRLCPREGTRLSRGRIGGRTTCWCPTCQPRLRPQ